MSKAVTRVWGWSNSYRILKRCIGICHPDSIECCDECLLLNGFDLMESD